MAKFNDILQIKVEPEMKASLERAANEDGELLSTLCRRVLRDHLRSRGFFSPAVPESGNTPKEQQAAA